jgi:hypothetical protein
MLQAGCDAGDERTARTQQFRDHAANGQRGLPISIGLGRQGDSFVVACDQREEQRD